MFLKNMDMFGKQVPQINMHRQTEVTTNMGGFTSLIIIIITFIFSSLKMSHLLTVKNPYINERVEHGAVEDKVYNTAAEHFQMAFAFEEFQTLIPLDDENFVKFVAVQWKVVDGERMLTELPIKRYTEADLSKFWPVAQAEKSRLEMLKKKNSLFCMDWSVETIEMWGTHRVKWKFWGCRHFNRPMPLKGNIDGKQSRQDPENCNKNQEELAKYLGNAYNLLNYYNKKDF